MMKLSEVRKQQVAALKRSSWVADAYVCSKADHVLASDAMRVVGRKKKWKSLLVYDAPTVFWYLYA